MSTSPGPKTRAQTTPPETAGRLALHDRSIVNKWTELKRRLLENVYNRHKSREKRTKTIHAQRMPHTDVTSWVVEQRTRPARTSTCSFCFINVHNCFWRGWKLQVVTTGKDSQSQEEERVHVSSVSVATRLLWPGRISLFNTKARQRSAPKWKQYSVGISHGEVRRRQTCRSCCRVRRSTWGGRSCFANSSCRHERCASKSGRWLTLRLPGPGSADYGRRNTEFSGLLG